MILYNKEVKNEKMEIKILTIEKYEKLAFAKKRNPRYGEKLIIKEV